MDTLASKEVVDHILSHHGVLGMKWGQRRSREELASVSVKTRSSPYHKTKVRTSGGRGLAAHPDAVAAKVVTQKLKKSGMHTLSNKELQDLATRTNLESQINRSGVGKSTVRKGLDFTNSQQGKELMSATSDSAKKIAATEAGRRIVKKVLKGAVVAAA
jgi:hypothetical protein